MELFDVIDSKGNPAGQIVSREKAHAEGIPHRTAHIWIIRRWICRLKSVPLKVDMK